MVLQQELPISRPYPPAATDRLAADKEVSELCAWYVDVQPVLAEVTAGAERMKTITDALELSLCKASKAIGHNVLAICQLLIADAGCHC